SYRLVLAKGKGDKPFLQGWAVVENPTDEDWRDVRMALVSGRPISFQMDLYQPLYVTRPVVEPELFASLRPVAYSGALDATPRTPPAAAGMAPPPPSKKDAHFAFMADGSVTGLAAGVPTDGTYARRMNEQLGKSLNLGGSGVATAATASKLGDF